MGTASKKRFGGNLDGVSSLMKRGPAAGQGGVAKGILDLDLDQIVPDPNQPRREDNPGFSKESLTELANSMAMPSQKTGKPKGNKTPISVREHPSEGGKFIINHGERRWRAARIAGLKTIRAYLDDDHAEADQIVENLQRDGLTARELADYIGRQMASGKRKADIARELGKSGAFVTQHVALLDLPEPIANAMNERGVGDVTLLNELLKAHKTDPEAVADFLSDDDQEVTRAAVKTLRGYLNEKNRSGDDDDEGYDDDQSEDEREDGDEGGIPTKMSAARERDPSKLKKAVVNAEYEGREARLVLDRRPSKKGLAWIRFEADGDEIEVEAVNVVVTSITEG